MGPEANRPEPIYRQIARYIRAQIASGELAEGEPIPSLTEIQRDWDVSMPTARQAQDVLRIDGLIAERPGRPAMVAPQRTIPAPEPVATELGIAEGDPVRVLADDRSVTYFRV